VKPTYKYPTHTCCSRLQPTRRHWLY